MTILNGKQLLNECNAEEKVRVNKCILHYYWNNDNLVLKGLVVPLTQGALANYS